MILWSHEQGLSQNDFLITGTTDDTLSMSRAYTDDPLFMVRAYTDDSVSMDRVQSRRFLTWRKGLYGRFLGLVIIQMAQKHFFSAIDTVCDDLFFSRYVKIFYSRFPHHSLNQCKRSADIFPLDSYKVQSFGHQFSQMSTYKWLFSPSESPSICRYLVNCPPLQTAEICLMVIYNWIGSRGTTIPS